MRHWKMVLWAAAALLLIGIAVLWSQGGTPRFYASAVEIRANPDQVFPYLAQPEKQKVWVSGLVEWRPQDLGASPAPDGSPAVGTRWVRVVEKQGARVEIETEVTRTEKNQLVQMRLRAPSFDAVNHFDLSPTGPGTTVTQNFTITYKGFARLLLPFTSDRLQQELQADLHRLRDTAEAATISPAGKLPPN